MKTLKILKNSLLLLALLPFAASAQSQSRLAVEDFTISAGETKTLAVDLINPDFEVTALQFDITLPDGLSIPYDEEEEEYKAEKTSRCTSKHSLSSNRLSNGDIRFTLKHEKNKLITGTEGAVINITIVASSNFQSGTIRFSNIVLSNPDESQVLPADFEVVIAPVQTTVSIKADDKTMVYGSNVPTLTYTVTDGNPQGEPALSCEATSQSPVGTYTINIAKGTLTNDVINLTEGTLTISKAQLTITAKSYEITQGDDLPEFEVIYRGFKNNDDKSVLTKQPIITCNATKNSEPGEYEIVVSGAEAENYNISYVAGTLTINKATIIDEDGSEYIVEDDNTVSFVGNENAGSTYSIPETITVNGVTYKVTTIAGGAFQSNTELKEITIPESIVGIGGNAFGDCTSLETINVKANVPPTCYDGDILAMRRASTVFAGVNKETCVVNVPEGCVEAYKNAYGWGEFTNITDRTTGIHAITADGKSGNIYDLQGRKVTDSQLSRGIYIMNGRKYVVK